MLQVCAVMYILYIMKRTQIYLSEEQGRYLDRRSKAAGTSMSELIREAIDVTYLRRPRTLDRSQRAEIARATAGAWKSFPETGKRYVERVRGARRLARLHRLRTK
jgi:Ribbon-helix-helix protein, copG family